MFRKNGFTMLELIIVGMIIGILVCVAIPSYNNAIWNIHVQDMEHNLITIANAQQKFYKHHGYYCGQYPQGSPFPNGCHGDAVTSTPMVNQALGLDLPLPVNYPPDPIYYCQAYPEPKSGFVCTASDGGGTNINNDTVVNYFSSNLLNTYYYVKNGPGFNGAGSLNSFSCSHQRNSVSFPCP